MSSTADWSSSLPSSWTCRPLKSAFVIQLGKMLQPTPRAPGDIEVPYFRAANVQWDGIRPQAKRMYANPSELHTYGVKVGDLLVVEGGEGGRASALLFEAPGHVIQNSLLRLRPRNGQVCLSRFAARSMVAAKAAGYFSAVNNASTIAHFTKAKCASMPVPFPPFDQVPAIVRYLDHAELRIARAIAAKSALLSRLNEARLAVVSELVLGDSDNRTSTGVPGLESVPTHWRWIRAKHVWRPVDVRSVRGSEERLSVSSARGVVLRSSANVTMFQAASYVGHKVVQPGNLVINSLWAWGRGLGVSRHFGLVSPVYGVYELVDKESDVSYLDHLLRSNAYQWQFQVRSKGIWKSRLSLSDDAFLDMPMLLPPLEEQRLISARISEQTAAIEAAITAVEREIALLKEYRVKLISDVVTGKLDVTKEAAGLPDMDPEELAHVLSGTSSGTMGDEEGDVDGDD